MTTLRFRCPLAGHFDISISSEPIGEHALHAIAAPNYRCPACGRALLEEHRAVTRWSPSFEIVPSPRPEVEPRGRTYHGTHASCVLTDDDVRALVGMVIDAGIGAETPFQTMRRLARP